MLIPTTLQIGRWKQAVLVPSHSGYCLGQLVRSVPQAVKLGARSAQAGYQWAPPSVMPRQSTRQYFPSGTKGELVEDQQELVRQHTAPVNTK